MWFLLKIDKYDIPTVVTKLYNTSEDAIEIMLPKFFEDLWMDVAETRHQRGDCKIEDDGKYTKGHINGLYPIYGGGGYELLKR